MTIRLFVTSPHFYHRDQREIPIGQWNEIQPSEILTIILLSVHCGEVSESLYKLIECSKEDLNVCKGPIYNQLPA